MTVDAEGRRCAAHEYRCPKRAAYQAIHAAGLRRDVLGVSLLLEDKRILLRRTWFFEMRIRRAIQEDIVALQGRLAGIYAHALTLGLDDGWVDPHFRPAALR